MMHKWRASFFSLLLVGALGLIFLTTGLAFAAAPVDTISYWKLDEDPAPLEYVDSVGTNNALPGVAAPAPNTDGIVGGAQDFDGAATQINVTDPVDGSFDFALTDSFTIECWMKSDKVFGLGDENQVLVGRDDFVASNMQWWLGMEGFGGPTTPGNVTFYLTDTAADEAVVVSAVPVNDDKWYHLVGIYDGTVSALYLYVNGVKVDEELAPVFNGDFVVPAGGADLNLGWLDLAPGYYYEGTLDEVAFYSRALTPTEIQEHYDNGRAGHGIDYVAPDTKKKGGGGGGGGCFITTSAE